MHLSEQALLKILVRKAITTRPQNTLAIPTLGHQRTQVKSTKKDTSNTRNISYLKLLKRRQ